MLIRDQKITQTVKVDLSDESQFQLDENGYLNADARISRTGIQTYSGSEIPGGAFSDQSIVHVLRPASEVFAADSLISFAGLPITAGHPPSGVNSENYTAENVGISIGEPVRDGDFVKVRLSIRDKETVEAVIANGGVEISNGYTVDLDTTAGTTSDGDSYDAIQRNIRGNHIALVDAARCGPECRIGDQVSDCGCASCQQKKEVNKMTDKNTVSVTIDGVSFPMDTQTAQAVGKLQGHISDRDNIIADLNEKIKQKDGSIAAHDEAMSKKDGEIAALKAEQLDAAKIDKLVADRAELHGKAKAIIGDKADLSGKSDAEVRKMAVAAKYGDEIVADADEAAIAGMFSVAAKDVTSDAFSGASVEKTTTTLDAALKKRDEKLSSAWKGN